jgi:hypothetical protein
MIKESIKTKGLNRTVKDPVQVKPIPVNEWKECSSVGL